MYQKQVTLCTCWECQFDSNRRNAGNDHHDSEPTPRFWLWAARDLKNSLDGESGFEDGMQPIRGGSRSVHAEHL
jgi:hypothetical protein